MEKKEDSTSKTSIAILSAWAGIILFLCFLSDVNWFKLGDFGFRTAMAYHGILIPAWMILALAYSQHVAFSYPIRKWLGIGAVSAGVLTGIGSILIRDQGFSLATDIQITGMILAEITAFAIIIGSFRHHCRTSHDNINATAWWTASVALIGLSLSTPLGHLAGAVTDLGMNFPTFAKHVSLLGIPQEEVLSGYIGSHSHQILAAFLAAAYLIRWKNAGRDKPIVTVSLNVLGA